MTTEPYYFPFEIVNKDSLIPGENYYIKLNDRIVRDFLTKRRNLPVSHLKGTFVRLDTEVGRITTSEYAVFKDVKIMNRNYKIGLCNLMLIRYPEGLLASTGCDTYSDRDRKINQDREVFFDVNKWIFGVPTETVLTTKKAIKKIEHKLNKDVLSEVDRFRGTIKGGDSKRKKTRRKTSRKTSKINRIPKTYRRY